MELAARIGTMAANGGDSMWKTLMEGLIDGSISGDIPEMNCTKVKNRVFFGATGIKSLKIPMIQEAGDYAFSGCSNLETLSELPLCSQIGIDSFRECFKLLEFIAPNLNILGVQCFRYDYRLTRIKIGNVSNFPSSCFQGVGQNAVADADGIKCKIELNLTVDETMAIGGTSFGGAPTTTKFICTDGYIVYENGAWTKHTSSSSLSTEGGGY